MGKGLRTLSQHKGCNKITDGWTDEVAEGERGERAMKVGIWVHSCIMDMVNGE